MGGEDSVSDTCGLDGGTNLVHADDGCAIEDCGRQGGDSDGFAGIDGRWFATMQAGEGVAEEGFSREAGEERAAEGEEGALAGQKSVVFVEFLAKAVAGVEDDGFDGNAGLTGDGEAPGEAVADEVQQIVGREFWLFAPLVGTAAGVHQDDAAAG